MKKYIKVLIIIAFYIGLILVNTKVYAETGKVNTNDVRLRSKATTSSDIVEVLQKNSTVEIISKEGDWYKVEYKDGGTKYEGYIRQDLLEISGEVNTTVTNETTNTVTANETTENTTQNAVNDTNSTETPTVISSTVELQEYTTITISNKLDLRILPLINSSVIGSVNANTQVNIGEIIGKWCYVEGAQISGWVLKSKVQQTNVDVVNTDTSKEDNKEKENNTTTDNETTDSKATDNTTANTNKENKKMYVNASSLNVRKEANTGAEVIDQLVTNTRVTVVEEVDSTWSKIEFSGKTGYVATQYLSEKQVEVTSRSSDETRKITNEETKEEKTETKTLESTDTEEKEETTNSSYTNEVTGEDVVAYAKTFLGKKYVYGGNGPDEFDCSGFTKYIFNHFGYTLYRTSGDQRKNGVAVSKSELQAGDLLCFEGHVGIYVGKNENGERIFIHAENPQTGVRISVLDQKSYTSTYVCARRIIK